MYVKNMFLDKGDSIENMKQWSDYDASSFICIYTYKYYVYVYVYIYAYVYIDVYT
jgi:hypothetical protein